MVLNNTSIIIQMLKGSDIEKRRVSIRKSIRREEMDNYFEERRRELLAFNEQAEIEGNLREELQSEEQRNHFLGRIDEELSQRPPSDWIPTLQQLQLSLPYFKGNFDQILNFRIIETLSSVFEQSHFRLHTQPFILKLLTEIINKQRNSNPAIVERVIMANVIHNSINFLQAVDLPLEGQYFFMYLYATLARINESMRNGMISLGVGKLVVSFAARLLQTKDSTEELRYNFLGICSDLLQVFPIQSVQKRYPSNSFVLPLIPLMQAFLMQGGSDRITKISLICIQLILKPRNELYFKQFLDTNLLNYLFSLTKVPLFCRNALNILSQMACSEADKVVITLSRMGIKDVLYRATCQADADYRFLILTLNIVDNLVASREEVMETIAHPIWQIVCRSLVHKENAVRIQAYHCINTIINFLDDAATQFEIIKSNRFINTVISQITDFNKRPAQLTQQALVLLQKYIILSLECFNTQAFSILQSVYNLSSLLELILRQSLSDPVLTKAGQVFDRYSQKYINDPL